MSVPCVPLVIRGTVQGVGFRQFIYHTARTLKLGGWVRNREDGAVEAEVVGSRPSLELLLKAVRQGPGRAEVTEVDESWSERDAELSGFMKLN